MIISSITRGIDIAENFEKSEEREAEKFVGERIIPAGELGIVASAGCEAETQPTYGPRISKTSSWVISQPITLVGKCNTELGRAFGGIHLTKGFYKLVCTLANVQKGGGLALFNQEKTKIIKVIAYHPVGSKENLLRQVETIYLQVNEAGIVGLVNSNAEFTPSNFIGNITVIVYKLKITPN